MIRRTKERFILIEKIIVLPRWKAESLDLNQRCRLISITDPVPFGQPAAIKRRWCLDQDTDLLRLEFDDVCRHGLHAHEDFGGHRLFPITADQGKAIAGFAMSCPHPVLVIHCEAGASRSPSAAMAIADITSLGRHIIQWGGFEECQSPRAERMPPNQSVYEAVLNGRIGH